ncbi:MAG: hypothetical protein ACR2NB_11485, partial [Solirubrobacteraceae bacterium]
MTPRFALERTQRIDASATTALLRISGTWTAPAPVTLGAAELEVAWEGASRRFPALPDPTCGHPRAAPEGVEWRAAFPVPADVADRGERLVLHAEGAP